MLPLYTDLPFPRGSNYNSMRRSTCPLNFSGLGSHVSLYDWENHIILSGSKFQGFRLNIKKLSRLNSQNSTTRICTKKRFSNVNNLLKAVWNCIVIKKIAIFRIPPRYFGPHPPEDEIASPTLLGDSSVRIRCIHESTSQVFSAPPEFIHLPP